MSRRKKNNESPISLFSFQDIITSITGVMLLVVMLMILEIISSRMADVASEENRIEEIADMKSSLQKLKEEQKELQKWLDENREKVQFLSANIEQIPELVKKEKLEKKKLSEQVEALATKERNATKRKEELLAELKRLEKKLEDLLAASGGKAFAELVRVQLEIKKLAQELEDKKDKVFFTTKREEGRNPVLVECSSKSLKIKIVKENKVIKLDIGSSAGALVSFSAWLKTRKMSREYITLLVKPSAVDYIQKLEKELRRTSFQYGLEPMEEDKTGVF